VLRHCSAPPNASSRVMLLLLLAASRVLQAAATIGVPMCCSVETAQPGGQRCNAGPVPPTSLPAELRELQSSRVFWSHCDSVLPCLGRFQAKYPPLKITAENNL
jgi:hypothetical protein